MIASVTKHASFAALRSDGHRVRSGPVSVVYSPVESEPALAFAIGKRFGNAVDRNRARRRLRAAIERVHTQEPLAAGAYQISGSRQVLEVPFDVLVGALERGCRRAVPADRTA